MTATSTLTDRALVRQTFAACESWPCQPVLEAREAIQ